MTTYRLSHAKGQFTRISNETLQDDRLSIDERGLLTLLLSYPDHWEPNIPHLAGVLRIGINRVNRALRDLKKHGYLAHIREREIGKFTKLKTHIYESPTLNPSSEIYAQSGSNHTHENHTHGNHTYGSHTHGIHKSGTTLMESIPMVSIPMDSIPMKTIGMKTADIETNNKETNNQETNNQETNQTHTKPGAQARVCVSPSEGVKTLPPSGGQKQPTNSPYTEHQDRGQEESASRVIALSSTKTPKDPTRSLQAYSGGGYSDRDAIRKCDDDRDRADSWFESREQEDQYFRDLRGFLQEFSDCSHGKATAIAKKSQLRLLNGKPEVDDRDYFEQFKSGGFQALKDAGVTSSTVNKERLTAKYKKAIGESA